MDVPSCSSQDVNYAKLNGDGDSDEDDVPLAKRHELSRSTGHDGYRFFSGRPKGSFGSLSAENFGRKSFGFGRKKFSNFGISAERGCFCRKRVFLQKEPVSAEIGG